MSEIRCDYTIDYMLERGMTILKNTMNKKNVKFIKPIIAVLNLKTYIVNYSEFCNSLNREMIQIQKFIENELKCKTSLVNNLDKRDETMISLKIEGKYKESQLNPIINRCIETYILCINCSSKNTEIIKINRINYIKCLDCLSERSITA